MDTVIVESRDGIARVRLNRPGARNALDETLISELTKVFAGLAADCRAVVLEGEGPVFCGGADIGWMKRSKDFGRDENEKDAASLAALLTTIDECPRPVIAGIQGAALGGGAGLVAACDIALAEEGAQFGFPEVRLGLIPAVISNFVLPKIGARAARRYFLTGERFGAPVAQSLGLIHEVVPAGALRSSIGALCAELLQCGPKAVAAAKQLIRDVTSLPRKTVFGETIRRIAELRVTPEAQEGLSAFLEKRKPRWP